MRFAATYYKCVKRRGRDSNYLRISREIRTSRGSRCKRRCTGRDRPRSRYGYRRLANPAGRDAGGHSGNDPHRAAMSRMVPSRQWSECDGPGTRRDGQHTLFRLSENCGCSQTSVVALVSTLRSFCPQRLGVSGAGIW